VVYGYRKLLLGCVSSLFILRVVTAYSDVRVASCFSLAANVAEKELNAAESELSGSQMRTRPSTKKQKGAFGTCLVVFSTYMSEIESPATAYIPAFTIHN
jgi:nitrogen fixation/metabolism regulation signal transduction histidine kinase